MLPWGTFKTSLKTFISCYRTPGPRKGFGRVSEGFQKGSLKGFRKVSEGFSKGFRRGPRLTPSKTLQEPFRDPFRDAFMVSKRVVLADVPPERKPERGYVRQNHPFTKPPFYLPVTLVERPLLISRFLVFLACSRPRLVVRCPFIVNDFNGPSPTPNLLNVAFLVSFSGKLHGKSLQKRQDQVNPEKRGHETF